MTCEHEVASSYPSFMGHCDRASCPNYLDACPRHETGIVGIPCGDNAPCTHDVPDAVSMTRALSMGLITMSQLVTGERPWTMATGTQQR